MATDFDAGLQVDTVKPFGPAWEAERQRRIQAWREERARAVTSNGVVGRVLTREERRARDKEAYEKRKAEFEKKLPELQAEHERLMQTPWAKAVRSAMPDSVYLGVSAGPIGLSYDSKTGYSHTVRMDDIVKDLKNWRNWEVRARAGGCKVIMRNVPKEYDGFQGKVNAGIAEASAKITNGGDLTLCAGAGVGYARPSFDVRVPTGAVTRFGR